MKAKFGVCLAGKAVSLGYPVVWLVMNSCLQGPAGSGLEEVIWFHDGMIAPFLIVGKLVLLGSGAVSLWVDLPARLTVLK